MPTALRMLLLMLSLPLHHLMLLLLLFLHSNHFMLLLLPLLPFLPSHHRHSFWMLLM